MRIHPDQAALEAFCRSHRIRRMAFFGSVLRDDFGPGSDVDVLVEFEPGGAVGMLGMAALERELSGLLGRKADLRTPDELSRFIRERVVAESQVAYVHG
jgi:predicted nucleotidyltransferase